MYKSQSERMPHVAKKPRVPKQVQPKKKTTLPSLAELPLQRLKSREGQEGIRPNQEMRRVHTLNGPLQLDPPKFEPSREEPSGHGLSSATKKPARSVRFGDNEVKEFVRASGELKYEKINERVNNRVILTQQKEGSEPDLDPEEIEPIEIPVFTPYKPDNIQSTEEEQVDPVELFERVQRLKNLADHILNV